MRRVAEKELLTDAARRSLRQGVEEAVNNSHLNLSEEEEAALTEETIGPLFNDALLKLADFMLDKDPLGSEHGLRRVVDIDGTVAFVGEKSLRRWQLAASKHLDHGGCPSTA